MKLIHLWNPGRANTASSFTVAVTKCSYPVLSHPNQWFYDEKEPVTVKHNESERAVVDRRDRAADDVQVRKWISSVDARCT